MTGFDDLNLKFTLISGYFDIMSCSAEFSMKKVL